MEYAFRVRTRICRIAIVLAFVGSAASAATDTPGRRTSPDALVGTWTGTSTCVGDRPACKNEIVVYRIVTIADHPHQVRLLADKILEGKRVPMGALVFDVDEEAGKLRNEFQIGRTHGVWTFTLAGDTMTGTLVVLPDGSKARDVKVQRARERDVPPAPAMSEYDE